MNSKKPSPQKILYLSFNQDSTCFSVGTESGFTVFNASPFKQNYERGNHFINNKFRPWRRSRHLRNVIPQ